MADIFDDIFDTISNISWSDVWDVGKVLVPAGAAIIGASNSSNANQANAQGIIQATNAQADQLQLGFDERLQQQLTALANARGQLDARNQAILDILTAAQTNYAGDIRAAAAAYIQQVPAAAARLGDLLVGNAQQIGQRFVAAAAAAGQQLLGAAGDFGTSVIGAAGDYRTGINAGSAKAQGMLLESGQKVREMLQPYADTGLEMMGQMRRIALSDPSRMTDAQRILLDDSRTEMGTRLATSGLRGSGAGIAAAMDAEAKLRAGLQQENRNRSDSFMTTLNNQGFQAAGAIGSAEQQALAAAAGVSWQATQLGEQAMLQAQNAAAKAKLDATQTGLAWGLDAEKFAANAEIQAFRDSISMQWQAATKSGELGYTAARDVAGNAYQTAGQVAGLTKDYFDTAAKYDLAAGDAIGAAAYGKREAEARSLGPIAAVQGAADVAEAELWGKAGGQLARLIADERSLGARPSVYSGNDTTGGGGNDTMGNWGYL